MSALVATTADAVVVSAGAAIGDIEYRDYTDETMLREIQVLVATDLSEPYSIQLNRYTGTEYCKQTAMTGKGQQNEKAVVFVLVFFGGSLKLS